MQYNLQKPEKRVRLAGPLSVHSIFHTIQGEGPFAGTPAVFVRLAGCNLQCPLCDTDYTNGRVSMTDSDILRMVNELTEGTSTELVVITGGEPFRQNLHHLFDLLIACGYYIQIETNGTLAPPMRQDWAGWDYCHTPSLKAGVYIVCSPKAGVVNVQTAKHACAYKYVGGAFNLSPEDGLPLHPLEHPSAHGVPRPPKGKQVYLQPTDEKDEATNYANMMACIGSCMRYGYTLQLQIHKIIGVE